MNAVFSSTDNGNIIFKVIQKVVSWMWYEPYCKIQIETAFWATAVNVNIFNHNPIKLESAFVRGIEIDVLKRLKR